MLGGQILDDALVVGNDAVKLAASVQQFVQPYGDWILLLAYSSCCPGFVDMHMDACCSSSPDTESISTVLLPTLDIVVLCVGSCYLEFMPQHCAGGRRQAGVVVFTSEKRIALRLPLWQHSEHY